ncbi:hypothetical protein ADU59_19550 [Pararhizobium polonicum]|uniref:Uncharacterized protein n=2 Tax=Pararhizobium polonicum TaxID=1612624 RepID=A0A1C7NY18_9HYPH|nr:hypothetical protein ADU59_19550 [Pararhizobium polonicum]
MKIAGKAVNHEVSIKTRVEAPMKQQSHIVDLLNAAKLLADKQGNVLLSYIINMAMIEASAGSADKKTEKDNRNTKAA